MKKLALVLGLVLAGLSAQAKDIDLICRSLDTDEAVIRLISSHGMNRHGSAFGPNAKWYYSDSDASANTKFDVSSFYDFGVQRFEISRNENGKLRPNGTITVVLESKTVTVYDVTGKTRELNCLYDIH